MKYDDCPIVVAERLLGCSLYRRTRVGLCAGRIVETEAYLAAGDSASHSFNGPNRKNASMFGPPGRAYVYTIHARQCVNVVTQPKGIGSAVLIRAVEPVDGIHMMQQRRGIERLRDLCRGPARLCEAFDIGRDLDGWDLLSGRRLWIEPSSQKLSSTLVRTARIGVTSARKLALRFLLQDSDSVSGTRRQNQAT